MGLIVAPNLDTISSGGLCNSRVSIKSDVALSANGLPCGGALAKVLQ
jgi:hypothetical protein